MEYHNKEKIAKRVKDGRADKGYTQQALSEITGISLRSIQRIEHAEVLPRIYTLKLLSRYLDFPPEMFQDEPLSQSMPVQETSLHKSPMKASVSRHLNHGQKIILTLSIGIVLVLLLAAFLAQSSGFPETDFELFLLIAGVICCYTSTLLLIWR
ncbi:MAG: helix-turn-helix transcriptional regulator [Cyclobacteriaceae bacterium]